MSAFSNISRFEQTEEASEQQQFVPQPEQSESSSTDLSFSHSTLTETHLQRHGSQATNSGSQLNRRSSSVGPRNDDHSISNEDARRLKHPQSIYRNNYEEIIFEDGQAEIEEIHCCNGLVPLQPLIVAINVIVVVSSCLIC